MPSHEHRKDAEATREDARTFRADTMPHLSRRVAMGHVAAVAAAGPLLFSLGCESDLPSAPLSDALHGLEYEHWHELVGDSFLVEDSPFHESEDGTGEVLVLQQAIDEEIEDDVHRPDHLPRKGAISLLFVAKPAARLPNATYTVFHAELGRFHLFLHEIPRSDHPDKRIYEAVLN